MFALQFAFGTSTALEFVSQTGDNKQQNNKICLFLCWCQIFPFSLERKALISRDIALHKTEALIPSATACSTKTTRYSIFATLYHLNPPNPKPPVNLHDTCLSLCIFTWTRPQQPATIRHRIIYLHTTSHIAQTLARKPKQINIRNPGANCCEVCHHCSDTAAGDLFTLTPKT